MQELISDLSQKIINYKHQVMETTLTDHMAMGQPSNKAAHTRAKLRWALLGGRLVASRRWAKALAAPRGVVARLGAGRS